MIKKSLKYFLIASVNATVLTLLLALWTDKLEMAFNTLVRPIEFLKIIGLTLLSLIAMRVVIRHLNKRTNNNLSRKKLIYSFLITVTISSYLYITYSINIYNKIFNETRHRLNQKIETVQLLAYGTKADNLTYEEYILLTSMTWFPEIPHAASKISYLYTYDGFLPDYTFRLTYEVPIETKIDTIEYEKGNFSKNLKIDTKGDIKIVTYEERQW